MVDEVNLLTHGDMVRLFPNCQILREKFLGIFTKSYVACRTCTSPPSTSISP